MFDTQIVISVEKKNIIDTQLLTSVKKTIFLIHSLSVEFFLRKNILDTQLVTSIKKKYYCGYVEKLLSVVFVASWSVDMWIKSYRLYFWPAG